MEIPEPICLISQETKMMGLTHRVSIPYQLSRHNMYFNDTGLYITKRPENESLYLLKYNLLFRFTSNL